MANPRKFSEKIALQKQKQAEGTAEFERIMKEVHQTKMDETQVNQKILEYCLRSGNEKSGGSGGGVDNQDNKNNDIIGGNVSSDVTASSVREMLTETQQLITTDGNGGNGGVETATVATANNARESRGRSVGVGPIRRPSDRKQDRSPYGSTNTFTNATNTNNTNFYLSPPTDSNWRRSNSDSALHQSLNMAVNAEMQNVTTGGNGGVGGTVLTVKTNNSDVVNNVGQHSPHMVRRLSANQSAMRRKVVPITNIQQQQQQIQQQQQQQHNFHMLQQQRQLQQHVMHQQQQQQQHLQEQQQQQYVVQQQQQEQQQLHFNNNKFLQNCNVSNLSPINNSFFKTYPEQSFGSLPDLTSVHFGCNGGGGGVSGVTTNNVTRTPQQQLSPLTIDNNYHDPQQQQQQQQRERTPSPYIEQQHSPNFAQYQQTTVTAAATTTTTSNFCTQEPLSVCIALNHNSPQHQQGAPIAEQQQLIRTNLPTLGAASSAGNLTEYRQPLNPPSPGSSPGLLTSASGNELHMSAPASPIRYMQNNANVVGGNGGTSSSSSTTITTSIQSGGNLMQSAFDSVFGNAFDGSQNSPNTTNLIDNNNSYNQFHNHFEHFTLGDSNSSPDQHQHQHNQQQQTYLDFSIDYGNMVDDDLTPDMTINDLTSVAGTNLIADDLHTSSTSSTTVAAAAAAATTTTGGGRDGNNLFNVVVDCDENKLHNDVKKQQQQQQHHIDDSRQHNYQQQQKKNTQTYSQRKHQDMQTQQQQHQHQQRLINKTATTNKSNNFNQNTDNINNNNNHLNNNDTVQQQLHNIDTTTANIVGLINSPTSPMPIPLPAAQSPIHQHHQQQQQQQQHAQSPHMQHQSPLHSPLTMHHHQHHHHVQQQQQQQRYQQKNSNAQQSPLHTTAASTTTTTDTSMSGLGSHHNSPMSSPLHSPAHTSVAYNGNSKLLNNIGMDIHEHQHNQQQQQQQQQFNQLLNDGGTAQTQNTNIPSIVFSDYSSNADMFDHFDIETLGSMDDVGLQMISEQNSIIITDASIEDSFRRDFN